MEITGAQLRTTAQQLSSLSIACSKNFTYSQLLAFHFATDFVKLSGHIHQSSQLNSTSISIPCTVQSLDLNSKLEGNNLQQ